MNDFNIHANWTLFLDRDGVLNQKIEGGYVCELKQFRILEGVLEAICLFNKKFQRILVVTNQQGIGKGLMTVSALQILTQHLQDKVCQHGGNIDAVYYCPHLASLHCHCRKPKIGMAQQAKLDFPSIEFTQSIMVGDAVSDMVFGKQLGMKTVFLTNEHTFTPHPAIDIHFNTLIDFANWLNK